MNQGRIWTVVKPTVGLPLLLGGVTTIALLVHYSVLSHTTWFGDYWQGKPKAKAELNTGASPVALNSAAQPGFVVSVAPAKSDTGAAAFVVGKGKPIAKSPPLDPALVGPMEALVARHFPGVPVIPTMSTGATDGVYLGAVGIPTYGVPGIYGDPDGNGEADTVGLTGTLNPVMVPSNLHGFDVIFNSFGSFPTLFWKRDGQIVYGSTQPETKEALALLARWYQEGIIDPDFATKNTDASNEIVVSGRSGIMIGPWWISWWPLNDSVKNDPNANWQPFMIKDRNGNKTYSMGDYTNSFVVVKKGYAHPEVVLKILNIQNDFSYGYNDAPSYYDNFNEIWNLLFPIPFLIEQPYVVERMGRDYQSALDGQLSPDTFGEAMKVEFQQIQADIASPRADSANWATRMARLDAAQLLGAGYDEVRADPSAVRFYSVDPNWPSLKKMEEEALLLIITGAQPVDYFDTFVQQWNDSGGAALLEAMNQ